MKNQLQEIKAIFVDLIENHSPEEWDSELDRVCEGKTDLRLEVEKLLKAHAKKDSFLDDGPSPTVLGKTVITPPVSEKPGDKIGPYKLLEQIGEGGMGVVYMAEQTEPVKRRVALKIIKPGMDTKQVVARFEAERQALALMDHQNIAKVLDAGTTESPLSLGRGAGGEGGDIIVAGRPYFVMELVRGIAITEYCDKEKLSTNERLKLFVTVCKAVQHAHQKGIIHRDIKPSNVLVTLHDSVPVPKVIDFGIAKAISQKLTENTLFTNFEGMIGTPLYMSPEQAEMSGLDIDTRSDIYSLGVLLYELLTGSTPFDREKLKQAGYDEIRRIIREDDPPTPSTRISSLGEKLSTVSQKRGIDARKLVQKIRGDLDLIVMMALEKNRVRRYETASAFAADVTRYLNDEPIEARPPSAMYRLRKFAKRKRGLLTGVGLVTVTLIVSMVIGSILIWNEREEMIKQRDRADDKVVELEQTNLKLVEAKNDADSKREESKSIQDFYETWVLAAARPKDQSGGLGKKATIRDAIDAAEPNIAQSFEDQPFVEGAIRHALGSTYLFLGDCKLAIKQYQIACGLWDSRIDQGHPDALELMANLAGAYAENGDLDKSIELYLRTLKLCKNYLEPNHRATLGAMNGLAKTYGLSGRSKDALPLIEETLRLRDSNFGPEHKSTLMVKHNLAQAYLVLGRIDLSISLHKETLAQRKKTLGDNHPDTLMSMSSLATGYKTDGRIDDAIRLQKKLLDLQKERLPADHATVLTLMNNLGETYLEASRLKEATELLEKAFKRLKEKFGSTHQLTLTAMNNLADAYFRSERISDAIPLKEELPKLTKESLGPDHPLTLIAMNNLARAYQDAGKLSRALQILKETVKLLKAKSGPVHPNTLKATTNLAGVYISMKKYDQARLLLEETLAIQKRELGTENPITLGSMGSLASLYWRMNKLELSIPLLEELLKLRVVKYGEVYPKTLNTKANLGINYRDADRLEEALPLLEEACRFTQKYQSLNWVRRELMATYVKAGMKKAATLFVTENVAIARKKLNPESTQLAGLLARNGLDLLKLKAMVEAELLLRESLLISQTTMPDRWALFYTKTKLGAALAGQRKFDEAEQLLLSGYGGMKKRENQIPLRGRAFLLTTALQHLVDLYTAWNKPDKAAQWQKKLEAAKTGLQKQKNKSKKQSTSENKISNEISKKPLVAPRPKSFKLKERRSQSKNKMK